MGAAHPARGTNQMKTRAVRRSEPIIGIIVQQPPPLDDRWVVLEIFQSLDMERAEKRAAEFRSWEGPSFWKTAKAVKGKFCFAAAKIK